MILCECGFEGLTVVIKNAVLASFLAVVGIGQWSKLIR
jgi:hypothetical protein